MAIAPYVLERLPRTDAELYETIKTLWGITIPATPVCPNHTTPFQAFADAFFARQRVTVWKASRGLGGKSRALAALGLSEAALLGAKVNILGGSGAQSTNVHEAMGEAWNWRHAPVYLLDGDPTHYETRLNNGAKIRALLASSRATRGPHPQRLRMDEIDEMDMTILEAAMGQPMAHAGVDAQVVLSSTHHYADGTMSAIMERASEKGWPVYEWCWKESNNKSDGWLTNKMVRDAREMVTKAMWEVEYDLQEPSHEGRAIDTAAVEEMFRKELGEYDRKVAGKEMWLPVGRNIPFEEPERKGEYVTGIDWAKEQDWTVISVYRTDLEGPWRLVAYGRFQRQPWPVMVSAASKTVNAYGGYLCHDATGIGNVVNDLIDYDKRYIKGEVMTGRHRQDMLTDYINGVEKGWFQAPRITSAYGEHKYATYGDIYEPGKSGNHLPDSIASGALAWSRRNKNKKTSAPVPVGTRSSSPWHVG